MNRKSAKKSKKSIKTKTMRVPVTARDMADLSLADLKDIKDAVETEIQARKEAFHAGLRAFDDLFAAQAATNFFTVPTRAERRAVAKARKAAAAFETP